MRQGGAELWFRDHSEAVDARMNEEALESRHVCGCQFFNMLLVVAHHAAPGHPIHVALVFRCVSFCFECSDSSRGRQAIQRHVYKQRIAASRGGAGRRTESFPLRATRLVDVNMRVHQARQNGGVTKVLNGNLRGQLIRQNNIEDSAVFDEHSCRFDSLRGHDST